MSPYVKGQSGNPAGRPPGVQLAQTKLKKHLREGDEADIIRTVVEAAKNGDMVAAKLILERSWPVIKQVSVSGEITLGALICNLGPLTMAQFANQSNSPLALPIGEGEIVAPAGLKEEK